MREEHRETGYRERHRRSRRRRLVSTVGEVECGGGRGGARSSTADVGGYRSVGVEVTRRVVCVDGKLVAVSPQARRSGARRNVESLMVTKGNGVNHLCI